MKKAEITRKEAWAAEVAASYLANEKEPIKPSQFSPFRLQLILRQRPFSGN